MNKDKTLFLPITLLVLVLPIFLFAQNKKQSDYLVLNTNDTLYGKVQYIKEGGFGGRKFYQKIRITDNKGKRKKYKRTQVTSFRKGNSLFESFWLSQHTQSFHKFSLVNPRYTIDSENGEQHFLRVINKGNLSHYELAWFDQENDALWSMSLLKKEGDQFFIRADQGILGLKRKVLLNYFSKCLELKDALRKKQLKKVWQVVEFYNANCTK